MGATRPALAADQCVLSGREHEDKSCRESDEGTGTEGAQHGPPGAEDQDRREGNHRKRQWFEALQPGKLEVDGSPGEGSDLVEECG